MGSTSEIRRNAPIAPVSSVSQPFAADAKSDDGFVGSNGLLRIEACRRLAGGGTRDVYQHPFNDNMLVKVIRPAIIGKSGAVMSPVGKRRRRKFRIGRLRRFGIYATFYREMRETLRAASKSFPGTDFPFPFPRAYGLVWTTGGLGLVVEKVASVDHALAPSLDTLIEEGRFTETHRKRLETLFDLCARNHLVLGDPNAQNFLYQDVGDGRFVVIDGIGEKSLVPIYELSALANRIKLRHKLRLLLERIENRMHAGDRRL